MAQIRLTKADCIKLDIQFFDLVDGHGRLSRRRCWLYHGPGGAYGTFCGDKAHRVAYKLKRGPIPAGMELDHLCRVTRCVNPWHLEVVTHRENTLRGEGVGAINAKKTHCPRGHRLDGANLLVQTAPSVRGHRRCLTCYRALKQAQDQRRRTRLRALGVKWWLRPDGRRYDAR